MNQAQKLQYLLRYLMEESPRYREAVIPQSLEEQRRLLRALLNTRPPNPVADAFLAVQDAYLQEEAKAKGIVDAALLPVSPRYPQLALWKGDITTLQADAIVNAANSGMLGCFVPCHGCIDNAIHTSAGVQLRMECAALMEKQAHAEPTGTAKITGAYNLPSRYVIHTVGPIISGKLTEQDCAQLASCYRACLSLAAKHQLSSIAFCCISTGEFHFPQEKAAEIAVETANVFLQEHPTQIKILFNVFKETDYAIYHKLLKRD